MPTDPAPADLGMLHLGDRSFPLVSGHVRLILTGTPPLVRAFLDLDVRGAEDAEGWAPHLESSSFLHVPGQPLLQPGREEHYAIPLKDAAGTSFNLKLYVFEHALIADGQLTLTGRADARLGVRLTGRSSLAWGPGDPPFVVRLEAVLPLRHVNVVDALDEAGGRAILRQAGLPETGWLAASVGRSGVRFEPDAREPAR